jgi:hypothetical protein
MRKFLFTLTLTLSCCAVFSQQDSLLKNFKYRIDHYRAVNFNVGAGGNYASFETPAGDRENSNFSSLLSVSFFSLKSTDRKLSFASANFASGYSSNKSDERYEIQRLRNFQVAPAVNFLNRYFTTKNNFWELGSAISGYSSASKTQYITQPVSGKDDLTHYSVTLNTGIGNGRLENITDMQNALWLNKALEKANRLSKPLTPGELNELGKSITLGNNTRVLDARKRTQFILETVDAYLQRHNLVSNTDIKYFMNLNDILFFAFNSPRLSGTEKFIRLSPSVAGSRRNQQLMDPFQTTKSNFDVYGALLDIGFASYKPSNLAHQNNYGASVRAGWHSGDFTDRYFSTGNPIVEMKNETRLKKAGVNLFYQHGIYPGTRTTISLELQTENGYVDASGNDGFYSNSSMITSASYFISYRTRFNFNAGVRYQENAHLPNSYIMPAQNNLQLFANAGIDINL